MDERQIAALMQEVQKDEIYQDLIKLKGKYEFRYQCILEKLTPRERQDLGMYISVCTGIESRLTRIAYYQDATE